MNELSKMLKVMRLCVESIATESFNENEPLNAKKDHLQTWEAVEEGVGRKDWITKVPLKAKKT